MLKAARSFIAAMRASAQLGRAFRYRDNGRPEMAIEAGRKVLVLLSAPYVNRAGAPEGSALLAATVLVEQIASELGADGAGRDDIADSLRYLKAIEPIAHYEGWVPYFEQRLNQGC